MWSGNITVGMPQQLFTVDFDTGSADLFLPGPKCITCQGHSVYDPSRSQTAHGLGDGFTLQYGDGSAVTGWQFEDTVSIAGLQAKEQTLGAASVFSEELAADVFEADGILGLGFSTLAQLNGAPVFETMMRQGQMESGVFSFRLAESNEGSSELYLGGIDSRYYTGNFTYTEVTVPAYWQTTLSALKIGSRLIGDDIPAIVDTGTTLILGDETRVRMLYEKIPGAREIPDNSGFWEIPCLSPPVSLVFGGKAFTLLPQAFVLTAQEAGEPGFCVGSIVAYMQSSSGESSDPGFWVVGDAFLRGVYSTFDVDNKRIGFADLRSTLDHI
ncbi:hypothetical protein EIP86_008441 [Pleurotus ostreatoroseus]|nr:hypothetical protein EIP86_008441 [Pleurotus ostreatoroseus]